MRKIALVALVLWTAGCGAEESGESTLSVRWSFASGDCATNSVESIRVTWTESGGPEASNEFACADGQGALGEIPSEGASYSIKVEGLDSGGVVRAENYGLTANFPDGRTFGPVDVELQPKASNVVVSWNGCPTGVVLPYFVSIYQPGDGAELGAKVTEVQEGCASGMATVPNVKPGDYVVEVDSRAVTPAVRGTAEVTVVAGEDATVSVDVP